MLSSLDIIVEPNIGRTSLFLFIGLFHVKKLIFVNFSFMVHELQAYIVSYSLLQLLLRIDIMLLFCPICANLLVAQEGRNCYQFACNTCSYVHNIVRKVFILL